MPAEGVHASLQRIHRREVIGRQRGAVGSCSDDQHGLFVSVRELREEGGGLRGFRQGGRRVVASRSRGPSEDTEEGDEDDEDDCKGGPCSSTRCQMIWETRWNAEKCHATHPTKWEGIQTSPKRLNYASTKRLMPDGPGVMAVLLMYPPEQPFGHLLVGTG